MSDRTEVRDLLTEHDPISQSSQPLDELAIERMWRGILDDIDHGSFPEIRVPVRRDVRLVRSGVAAVVVALLVLGGLVVVTQRQSPSSTHYVALQPLNYSRSADPISAAAPLRALATVAQAQPAAIAGGWYYLETASWSTFGGSDTSDLPAGMPKVLEQWINPDGSVRVVDHVDLPAPASGLKAWLDAGLPLTGGRSEAHTTAHAPQQFPTALSTDAPTLQKQLLDAELGTDPTGGPPANVELFTAIKDLRASAPIDGSLQAALLRVLAAQPDVVSLGTTTDRLGRVADAVAIDSDYSGLDTRYVLLFDPTDGQLLGSEDILVKSSGSLKLSIPSVISYVIYVRDGHVSTDTSTPPPL
jgi:hypothetical protein